MCAVPDAFPHEVGADPRLLRFLDRLSEPLSRTLSQTELAEYRLHALGHLEALASDLREYEGFSADDSVERALREYGQPDLLAIGLLDERCKGTRPVGFARGARSATLWSFVWFGLASAAFLTLVGLVAQWPGYGSLRPFLEPVAWGAPVVAGVFTGRTVPTGNLAAALPAMGVLLLHAGAVALLLRPDEGAARLALGSAFLAIPLGCASILLTATLRRRPVRPSGRGLAA